MTIGFFQTIDAALSQAVAAICRTFGISEDEAIWQARQYLAENSAAYWSDTPQLEYHNPLCRIAYLYAYVGAHANLVDNVFYAFSALAHFIAQKLRTGETITACSLGGGPGSELLGLVKYIDRIWNGEAQVFVDFALVDNVREWDETWQALLRGIEATFATTYGSSRGGWPVIVQRSFISLNLTDVEEFRHLPTRFQGVELFILNYALSELFSHRVGFTKVLSYLTTVAPDGAFFLIIDRNQEIVRQMAHAIIDEIGLQHLGTVEEERNMDQDEQVTDLGTWYERMGRHPKLQWSAFYLLAQKQGTI